MTWNQIKEMYIEKLKYTSKTRRECFDFLYSKLLNQNISLIGLRQVGKTTLGEQLLLKYYEDNIDNKTSFDNDVYYVNLISVPTGNVSSISSNLHNELRNNKYKVVLIDEIQVVDGWVNLIQSLVDLNKNTKFIFSGSSAKNLSKQLAVGRFYSYYVNPLSFNDYKKLWKDENFDTYLRYGSYPPDNKYFNAKLQYTEQVRTSIIDKVIFDESIVNVDPDKFYKSMYRIKNYIGNEINKLSIAEETSISRNTLETYLALMTSSRLIQQVSEFENNNIKQKVKLYFNDKSMINHFNSNDELNSNDYGALIENLVFNYLDSRYNKKVYDFNVFYYKNNIEIDFIVPSEKLLIEVKYRTENVEWNELTTKYNQNIRESVKGYRKVIITKDIKEICNDWELIPLTEWIKEL